MDSGRKKSRMDEVKMIRRESESSIQVIDLSKARQRLSAISRFGLESAQNVYYGGSPCSYNCLSKTKTDFVGQIENGRTRHIITFRGIEGRATHLKPQILRHAIWAHVWSNVHADYLLAVSSMPSFITFYADVYLAMGILLSHFQGP